MLNYLALRDTTLALCEGLSAEDMTVQAMADASPSKWHLAHTTWFFERFILQQQVPNYRVFNTHFDHLFNSYYESLGTPYLRPKRGLLTRPALTEVLAYRHHVDQAMASLLDRDDNHLHELITVGLHHEMQHQELLLTDVLYLLAQTPLAPALKAAADPAPPCHEPLQFIEFDEAFFAAGASTEGFAYDCERPAHRVWLAPFALANRPVSNAEWLEFIRDGGYQNPAFWLSDGWATCQREAWQAPLYWHKQDDQWHQFGLDGSQPIDLNAPVCHVSLYEASAFTHWAGKRLPSEHELERACAPTPAAGANFLECHLWRPRAASGNGVLQLYGDVWEWTHSAFSAYPKFRPAQGALAEYNGKFMANQFVLRGGSCVTPKAQMRRSYRNFFYPQQRWQFSGLRLAHDI